MSNVVAISASDKLLTAKEVAGRLRVHPQAVMRWFAAGLLPGVRLSSRITRFAPEDVEAFIDRGRNDLVAASTKD